MTCSTAHAVPDVSCSECNNFGGGFRLGTICFFPRHFSDLAGIVWVLCLRPCLVPKKFCKIFQISSHIESLDTCMKY